MTEREIEEIARELRRLVDQGDLVRASHILPTDHPIRPALKRAINKNRGGSYQARQGKRETEK